MGDTAAQRRPGGAHSSLSSLRPAQFSERKGIGGQFVISVEMAMSLTIHGAYAVVRITFIDFPSLYIMSRISILQQRNLGSIAEDLVSPADARADLVVLSLCVARRVELGLQPLVNTCFMAQDIQDSPGKPAETLRTILRTAGACGK